MQVDFGVIVVAVVRVFLGDVNIELIPFKLLSRLGEAFRSNCIIQFIGKFVILLNICLCAKMFDHMANCGARGVMLLV